MGKPSPTGCTSCCTWEETENLGCGYLTEPPCRAGRTGTSPESRPGIPNFQVLQASNWQDVKGRGRYECLSNGRTRKQPTYLCPSDARATLPTHTFLTYLEVCLVSLFRGFALGRWTGSSLQQSLQTLPCSTRYCESATMLLMTCDPQKSSQGCP